MEYTNNGFTNTSMKIDPNGKTPPSSIIIVGSINLESCVHICNTYLSKNLICLPFLFTEESVLEQYLPYRAHRHFQTSFVQELHPQDLVVAQQINKCKQQ